MFKYALVALLAGTTLAHANPITGSLSIDGTDSYTSSTITFNGPGNIGTDTATGDFATYFSAGCVDCVNLNTVNLRGPLPETIYSATDNGVTTDFVVTGVAGQHITNDFISIDAVGYADLTGFDQTPGDIYFTTQGGYGHNVTFSATVNGAQLVPEPMSLAMLGGGLLGVGMLRRKNVA